MSDVENQRATAEARRSAAAHSDHPEREELMLRYLGAEFVRRPLRPVAAGCAGGGGGISGRAGNDREAGRCSARTRLHSRNSRRR